MITTIFGMPMYCTTRWSTLFVCSFIVGLFFFVEVSIAFTVEKNEHSPPTTCKANFIDGEVVPSVPVSNRRQLLRQSLSVFSSVTFVTSMSIFPDLVAAKPDCFVDCFKNCKAIVPNDLNYCKEECTEYCEQPDRQDGLSGSISSEKGEVGILGGTFGTGTVVRGEDKPPIIQIPGLNFSSGEGKKLIGY